MTVRDAVNELMTGPGAPSAMVVAFSTPAGRQVAVAGMDAAGSAITTDSLFDIASVSKVVATTTALMRLVSDGRLRLDDSVVPFVPEARHLADVTVRDLLTHRAGLWEWQPLYLTLEPWRTACELPLRYPTGEGRHYSDLGFLTLGRIIESVTGTDLASAVTDLVTAPFGLGATGYNPARSAVPSSHGDTAEQRMVATGTPYPIVVGGGAYPWRTADVLGQPNDGNAAHAFGGVAGHAGLFSTADDLITIAQALAAGTDLIDPAVTAEFFADGPDAGQALGWRSRPVTYRGRPERLLFHPGFTGCALAFIPGGDLAVVLLSNRLMAAEPLPTDALWTRVLHAVPDLDITTA